MYLALEVPKKTVSKSQVPPLEPEVAPFILRTTEAYDSVLFNKDITSEPAIIFGTLKQLNAFQRIMTDSRLSGSLFFNPYIEEFETFPENPKELTFRHLAIFANEKMNTTGEMNLDLVQGLGFTDEERSDKLARIRALVTELITATNTQATHSGKLNRLDQLQPLPQAQDCFFMHAIGIQWQDDYRNTGGLYFYPDDPEHKDLPKGYTEWQNATYNDVHDYERPETAGDNTLTVTWETTTGKSVPGKLNLDTLCMAFAKRFRNALFVIQHGAREDLIFRFLKDSLGFFASGLGKTTPVELEIIRLNAIDLVLEGLLGDPVLKQHFTKIKGLKLPFSDSGNLKVKDALNKIEQKLIKAQKDLALENFENQLNLLKNPDEMFLKANKIDKTDEREMSICLSSIAKTLEEYPIRELILNLKPIPLRENAKLLSHISELNLLSGKIPLINLLKSAIHSSDPESTLKASFLTGNDITYLSIFCKDVPQKELDAVLDKIRSNLASKEELSKIILAALNASEFTQNQVDKSKQEKIEKPVHSMAERYTPPIVRALISACNKLGSFQSEMLLQPLVLVEKQFNALSVDQHLFELRIDSKYFEKLHWQWKGAEQSDVIAPGFYATTDCGDSHALITNEGRCKSVDGLLGLTHKVAKLNHALHHDFLQCEMPNPDNYQSIKPTQLPAPKIISISQKLEYCILYGNNMAINTGIMDCIIANLATLLKEKKPEPVNLDTHIHSLENSFDQLKNTGNINTNLLITRNKIIDGFIGKYRDNKHPDLASKINYILMLKFARVFFETTENMSIEFYINPHAIRAHFNTMFTANEWLKMANIATAENRDTIIADLIQIIAEETAIDEIASTIHKLLNSNFHTVYQRLKTHSATLDQVAPSSPLIYETLRQKAFSVLLKTYENPLTMVFETLAIPPHADFTEIKQILQSMNDTTPFNFKILNEMYQEFERISQSLFVNINDQLKKESNERLVVKELYRLIGESYFPFISPKDFVVHIEKYLESIPVIATEEENTLGNKYFIKKIRELLDSNNEYFSFVSPSGFLNICERMPDSDARRNMTNEIARIQKNNSYPFVSLLGLLDAIQKLPVETEEDIRLIQNISEQISGVLLNAQIAFMKKLESLEKYRLQSPADISFIQQIDSLKTETLFALLNQVNELYGLSGNNTLMKYWFTIKNYCQEIASSHLLEDFNILKDKNIIFHNTDLSVIMPNARSQQNSEKHAELLKLARALFLNQEILEIIRIIEASPSPCIQAYLYELVQLARVIYQYQPTMYAGVIFTLLKNIKNECSDFNIQDISTFADTFGMQNPIHSPMVQNVVPAGYQHAQAASKTLRTMLEDTEEYVCEGSDAQLSPEQLANLQTLLIQPELTLIGNDTDFIPASLNFSEEVPAKKPEFSVTRDPDAKFSYTRFDLTDSGQEYIFSDIAKAKTIYQEMETILNEPIKNLGQFNINDFVCFKEKEDGSSARLTFLNASLENKKPFGAYRYKTPEKTINGQKHGGEDIFGIQFPCPALRFHFIKNFQMDHKHFINHVRAVNNPVTKDAPVITKVTFNIHIFSNPERKSILKQVTQTALKPMFSVSRLESSGFNFQRMEISGDYSHIFYFRDSKQACISYLKIIACFLPNDYHLKDRFIKCDYANAKIIFPASVDKKSVGTYHYLSKKDYHGKDYLSANEGEHLFGIQCPNPVIMQTVFTELQFDKFDMHVIRHLNGKMVFDAKIMDPNKHIPQALKSDAEQTNTEILQHYLANITIPMIIEICQSVIDEMPAPAETGLRATIGSFFGTPPTPAMLEIMKANANRLRVAMHYLGEQANTIEPLHGLVSILKDLGIESGHAHLLLSKLLKKTGFEPNDDLVCGFKQALVTHLFKLFIPKPIRPGLELQQSQTELESECDMNFKC